MPHLHVHEQENVVPPPERVCVVGSGWRFLSGISYYTCGRPIPWPTTTFKCQRFLCADCFLVACTQGNPESVHLWPTSVILTASECSTV